MFVILMADDAGGRWGHELPALGAVVGRYDEQIRVYTAHVAPDVLRALLRADHVLAVEPVRAAASWKPPTRPRSRQWARMRSGHGRVGVGLPASSAPVAVMDGGLNVSHADVRDGSTSICGATFVSCQARAQDGDLWLDASGHGEHVTGTFIGNGFGAGAFASMAPTVRHLLRWLGSPEWPELACATT